MTERLNKFLEFVKEQHGDQKRKYTGEPYWHHLVAVMEKVAEVSDDECYLAIALGHDLFEDTKCGLTQVDNFLSSIGFDSFDVVFISNCIRGLTDIYTKDKVPKLNRLERKHRELIRLSDLPVHLQTIKYADLIDNTKSIKEHDPKFSEVYLKEKAQLLEVMNKGNTKLYNEAMECIGSFDAFKN